MLAIKPKKKHLKCKYGSPLKGRKSSKVQSKLKEHVQHFSSFNSSGPYESLEEEGGDTNSKLEYEELEEPSPQPNKVTKKMETSS